MKRGKIVGALMCVSALLVTGCSQSDSADDSDGKSGDSLFSQELHDAVPDKYQDKTIQVAAFNDWPPDEFVEDGELKGWSVEMADAIFEVLGLKYEISGTTFESILPGLSSKRYDAGFASFGVTPERLEVLDFVPQRREGTGYGSLASDPIEIKEPKDLCGHSVAALTGAWDYQYLVDLSKNECESDPITIKQFKAQNEAELAVSSGRVEIVAAGSAKLQYAAKQSGTIQVSSLLSNPVYNGIGLRKDDVLAVSIQSALQELIDDGEYEEIMARWGVDGQGLLEEAVLVTEDNPEP